MFYIVQMSDFHFDGSPATEEQEILTRMANRIRQTIPANSTVVLCVCGDYIDSRPITDKKGMHIVTKAEAAARYTTAKRVLESTIIGPLRSDYNLKIGMCVGNHDTTHLNELNQFSQEIIGKSIDKTYFIHLDADNVDLVFVNSCSPDDYSHGEINYTELEKLLESRSPTSFKYIFMHHTLLSMDKKDTSSIREASGLIRLIDKYSIKAVFHGHTHGQYLVHVGTVGCPIVGVGAVFVRDYSNVNSQFNLICCNGGIPVSADAYNYHADLATNPDSDGFIKTSRPITKSSNFFSGTKISKVYEELIEKVRAESKLYHVHLHVNSRFDDFCMDVNESFGNKRELKTLDNDYSYNELAEMWENSQVNTEVLYFNHGQYYPEGIEGVLKELERNRTSSRAVMVTVNSNDISRMTKTAPDALLPSMMSIQVGFNKDRTTLYVTMTLRALEASRFLKINICEILYVAQRIYEKQPFDKIEVELSAFRVQIKENFGCFLRAKLDTMCTQHEITVLLSSLNYSVDHPTIENSIKKITSLIRDKMQRSETVIETAGLESLLQSVIAVQNQGIKESNNTGLSEICNSLKELLEMLNQMKQHRESSSEENAKMIDLEKQIQTKYESLICSFERLAEL